MATQAEWRWINENQDTTQHLMRRNGWQGEPPDGEIAKWVAQYYHQYGNPAPDETDTPILKEYVQSHPNEAGFFHIYDDKLQGSGTVGLNDQQSQILRSYLENGPDHAAQQQILNGQFGGDFNAYANWWIGSLKNNPGLLDQNSVSVLGQLADAGFEPAKSVLDAGGYEPATQPLEQGLLNQALPGLQADIANDANRRNISDALAMQTIAGSNAATTQLARGTGGHFDSATYFAQNPSVKAAFDAQHEANPNITADQFAEQHYLTVGQQAGLKPAYIQDAQLAQDFNNADQTTAANIASSDQATQSQLTALQSATAQLQQNLTGDLAAKAAALSQQLASLNQNIDQLDASQRAALTQQIATQQQDLETSIATQRQGLQDQMAALGNAADAESQAKRASLNQEIQGLTAAQAPLNAARVAAADLQATAINTGLQRTQDQLTAQNALGGYVGGSTGQDAALARATIDARQAAAGAMGSAQVANASDTRDIGVRGATGQRTISDALAEAKRQIAGQGATGNYGLTTNLAQGRQQLGDTQASGLASITNNTAQARAGVGAYGANTTYGNVTTGADQSRGIADSLAQGQYGLTSTNAQQVQQAQNQGAAAKATYYDNDWARSLSSALAPASIAGNLTNTLTGLDNYANSGLGRSLNTLNWWSTNQGTPPTPGAVAVQPGTTGNSLSQLGAGLFGAATSYGNANNWWTTPKPAALPPLTTPTMSATPIQAGGSNLYTSTLA